MSDSPLSPLPLSRRDFLATSAKLGAAVLAAPYIMRGATASASGSQTVNVALIGCGDQGRILINASLKIPGIRYKAVCDIWGLNRTHSERLLGKFGHGAKPFEDYREMLASTPDLDAVPEGGLGIFMINALVDEVVYESGTPNVLSLTKRTTAAEPSST